MKGCVGDWRACPGLGFVLGDLRGMRIAWPLLFGEGWHGPVLLSTPGKDSVGFKGPRTGQGWWRLRGCVLFHVSDPFLSVSLQPIEKLVALLNTLDRWIDETPPVDQPSRFGNKAFRTWYAKLDQVSLFHL